MSERAIVLAVAQWLVWLIAFLFGYFLGARNELNWMRRELGRMNSDDEVLPTIEKRGALFHLRWRKKGVPIEIR